jgi:hypothetical protein
LRPGCNLNKISSILHALPKTSRGSILLGERPAWRLEIPRI